MTLYGVVSFVNGNPVLDGMECFSTKEEAFEYTDEQEKLYQEILEKYPKAKEIENLYTIIRLNYNITKDELCGEER